MSTYLVAMMTVHDPDTYRKYTDRTPATVKKHGGRFLTRGQEVSTLEGEPYEGRMVILEFPSTTAAQAWLADPDYEEAATFRHVSSTMSMLLMQDGGDNTENPDPKL